MYLRLLMIAIVAGSSASLVAQKPAWEPAPGQLTVPLWPDRAPGAPANPPAEADMTTARDNLVAGKPVIRLGNVSSPTITVYVPPQNNTGAAVVVFPGGGYSILAIDLEGTEVCGTRYFTSAQVIPAELSQAHTSVPSRSMARMLYPPPGNTTTAAPVLFCGGA
jgi:hypothetical protein